MTLTTGIVDVASGEAEILRVHNALEEMAARDERMAGIVEMQYFAGMTQSEIAEAIGGTSAPSDANGRRRLFCATRSVEPRRTTAAGGNRAAPSFRIRHVIPELSKAFLDRYGGNKQAR